MNGVVWHHDVTGQFGGGPDGMTNGHDPWYWLAHDEGWRHVATFRGSDTNLKERLVFHMAGLDGMGGSSYIDEVLLRDRDANTAWKDQADSTAEERLYPAHNRRGDLVALVTSAGKMVEMVLYSSYGEFTGIPAGDSDSSGVYDVNDRNAMTAGGAYDVREDADLDGDNDAADATWADSIAGGDQTLGWGVLSSGAVSNRRGYAGYELASELLASGAKYHVRHRFYDAVRGVVAQRDPLGYVDGVKLYEYALGSPVVWVDPYGLRVGPCSSCNSGGGRQSSGSEADEWDTWQPQPGDIVWPNERDPMPFPRCPKPPARAPAAPPPTLSPPPPPAPPAPNDWRTCPQFSNCKTGIKPRRGARATTNGCGATWWQKFALHVGYVPYLPSFTPCCNVHDACYGSCGADKNFCDRNILACMQSACNALYPGPFNRWTLNHRRCMGSAQTIYQGVQSLGKGAFCTAQSQKCVCADAVPPPPNTPYTPPPPEPNVPTFPFPYGPGEGYPRC